MRLYLRIDPDIMNHFCEIHPERVDPIQMLYVDRIYYVGGPTVPPAIIVCQNNLVLPDLTGAIVDVVTGIDIALRAYCIDYAGHSAVEWTGKHRPKITIRGIANAARENNTLLQELREWK